MLKFFLPVLFVFACSVPGKEQVTNLTHNSTNPHNGALEPDTTTVILEYAGWGCPCPQWISRENRLLYEEWKKENDAYPEEFFYNIEWGKPPLPNPLDELINDTIETPWTFEFTGQFYKEPKFLGLEGELWKGRTLRYYSVRRVGE
jgi:hypothetical protein